MWMGSNPKKGRLPEAQIQKFNCTQRQKESAHRRGTQNHYCRLLCSQEQRKIQRTPVAQQRTAQQKADCKPLDQTQRAWL